MARRWGLVLLMVPICAVLLPGCPGDYPPDGAEACGRINGSLGLTGYVYYKRAFTQYFADQSTLDHTDIDERLTVNLNLQRVPAEGTTIKFVGPADVTWTKSATDFRKDGSPPPEGCGPELKYIYDDRHWTEEVTALVYCTINNSNNEGELKFFLSGTPDGSDVPQPYRIVDQCVETSLQDRPATWSSLEISGHAQLVETTVSCLASSDITGALVDFKFVPAFGP